MPLPSFPLAPNEHLAGTHARQLALLAQPAAFTHLFKTSRYTAVDRCRDPNPAHGVVVDASVHGNK